jgi:hypothetical protein
VALDLQLKAGPSALALEWIMSVSVRSLLAVAGALLATTAGAAEPLGAKEAKELGALGSKAFRIRWTGPLTGASERGVMAVSDGVTTLTTRKGSRTYIVHNRKLTQAPDKQQFSGSDAELQRLGLRMLQAAGADRRQVAEVRVLQQQTQAAEVYGQGQGPRLQPVQRGMRSLLVTRQIDGIPVPSSRVLLNLDRAGNVAFMELSWPDVGPEVVEAAQRLRKAAGERFEAPRMDGATVESVQASILHSPAVGFYNDTTAALRVIYRPDSKILGQKAVRYIDASGKDVGLPRDVDPPREEPVTRKQRP